MSHDAALDQLIAMLEAQRASLGDAAVDLAIAAVHERLEALPSSGPDADIQRRRQISVLFVDIVGSTSLLQGVDPEDALVIVGVALRRFADLIEAAGGRVLRYTGDGLKAAFGSEYIREDDAERAVAAGLAILAAARQHAAQLQGNVGIEDFAVRVGINTGDVVLGGGAEADHTAMGHAVNVAARLEQAAPPGRLLIGERTGALVRGRFEVQPQALLHVKGVSEPVKSYVVERSRPREFKLAGRGIEGVHTRMIGRDADLAMLQQAFERIVAPGAGLLRVLVVADAGVGKSRLLDEFQQWIEAQARPVHLFQARATPHTVGQPFGLLRELLARRLGILDTDDMTQAQRRFEDGLRPLLGNGNGNGVGDGDGDAEDAEASLHLLGQLIGIDYGASRHVTGVDARVRRRLGFAAVSQALRRLGTSGDGGARPIVLQLDDLHWADDASLDLIDHLAKTLVDVPVLLLALARPTLFERRESLAAAADGELRITLQPLDAARCALLVDELLKPLPDAPAALHHLLTERAAGNPFYIEELLKMLIDQGAIDTAGAHWSVDAGKLHALQVPPTLTGVLQARLDGLPASERHTLQLASVIGMLFWDAALAHVEPGAETRLPPLAGRELIHAQNESSAEGAREFAFHHAILHQVTYDTVLKSVKRSAHARAADWLSQLAGAQGKGMLGITAEHYEQAADLVNAVKFYARAAEHAADTYANDAALDYATRALHLLEKDGTLQARQANPDQPAEAAGGPVASDEAHALRWRLLAARTKVLDMLGRRDAQRADIEALLALAAALPPGVAGDGRRAESAILSADFASFTADWQRARLEGQRAQALAERVGDALLAMRAINTQAIASARMGETAAGAALAQRVLASARVPGDWKTQGRALTTLAIIDGMRGDSVGSLRWSEQALTVYREARDRSMEALALSNLGEACLNFGSFAEARLYLQEGLLRARKLGFFRMEGATLEAVARLTWREGDPARALESAQRALDVLTESGARDQHAQTLWTRGTIELALGRVDDAASTFQRFEAEAHALNAPFMLLSALEGQVRVALARNDRARGLDLANRILAAADARPSRFEGAPQPLIQLSLHRALALADDARADAMLTQAHAALAAASDGISDPALREGFLTNIAEHREIVALWAERSDANGGLHPPDGSSPAAR